MQLGNGPGGRLDLAGMLGVVMGGHHAREHEQKLLQEVDPARVDDDDGLGIVGAGDLDAGVDQNGRLTPVGGFLNVGDKGGIVVVGDPDNRNALGHARSHEAGSPILASLFVLRRPARKDGHAHPIPVPRRMALKVSAVPDRNRSIKELPMEGRPGQAQAQLLVEGFFSVVQCG